MYFAHDTSGLRESRVRIILEIFPHIFTSRIASATLHLVEFWCKILENATNVECFQGQNFHFLLQIKDAKGAIKNGGSTTLHSKAKGGKRIGLDFKKKTLFLGFSNFSKVFKRLCVLEHSRENSLLDLDLDGVSFPCSLLKRVKLIFISLFPSRASNIHPRRTLKVTTGVR